MLLWIAAVFVAALALLAWRVSQRRKLINKTLEEQNLRILEQREEIAMQNTVLSRSNRELDELNHEKDTLMNIVAHDLKSPLNRIHGLVRILELEGNLNNNQHEYVRMSKTVPGEGSILLRTCWMFMRGMSRGKNHHILLLNLISSLLNGSGAFQVVADGKEIKLEVENNVDQKVISEPNYLGRILDNLVSNAIKFSPRNESIKVKASWSRGVLQISVRDHGPGFSEDDKKSMFQKFKKLSARPTAGESSNGLGLAIVKTLVDRLDGSIKLESTRGEGSEFLIEIPVRVVQQVPA
ncbi:MAG: HAMP domain-containing sensor histidine kinase [Bacteroidota bacterium]